MFRRPDTRFTRGRMAGLPATAFHRLVSSVSVIGSWQSDLGVTLGTGVSAWADQTGNGYTLSQAAGGQQPAYNATGLNGKPTITFDGTDDFMSNASLDLPAAPYFYWMVFSAVSWTVNDTLLASGSNGVGQVLQRGSTPQIGACNNGVSGAYFNTGAVLGSWYRMRVSFTNSTSDYIRIGSTNTTGTNMGTAASAAGFNLGKNTSAANYANISVAALMVLGGTPSAAELSALDAAVTRFYGASVGVG